MMWAISGPHLTHHAWGHLMDSSNEGRTLDDLMDNTPEVRYIATMQTEGVIDQEASPRCGKLAGFTSHEAAYLWITDNMTELQGSGNVIITMHVGTPFTSVRSDVGPTWGWVAEL